MSDPKPSDIRLATAIGLLVLRTMEESPYEAAGQPGWCCACGEGPGDAETPCPKREDGCHCEHWWDGPDEEAGHE